MANGTTTDKEKDTKAESVDLPDPVVRRGVSEAQWRTLCDSLFPGANPRSVLMVIDYCAARKLDPLKKPCHIVPMKVKDARTGQYEWRDVVMPGIYEIRTTAHRTGVYLGHSKIEYGPMVERFGVTAPEWLEATFYRAHTSPPYGRIEFPVRRYFAEIVGLKDGHANERWSRAPIQMAEKCFDDQTEVLTDAGFRRFADVKTAQILQVSHVGELEPVVATPFMRAYDGPMVTLDGDQLNFSVTPNHEMVTTHGKIEAEVLYTQARRRPKFWIPRAPIGKRDDNPDLTDAALKLAAAYLADGTCHTGGGNTFSITVSKNRKVAALRELALHHHEGVGNVAGDVAHASSGRMIVTRTSQTRFSYAGVLVAPLVLPGKQINVASLLSLSRRQARIFVDTLIEFDGTTNATTGVRRFFTSRLAHLHAFEIACVLAGYGVNVPRVQLSDLSAKPNYIVTISERETVPVCRFGRPFHHTVPRGPDDATGLELRPNVAGHVWCVTVPSGVIVVRRHGFSMLCGNCLEAAGLREAFPEEFGGEQTAEEMEGVVEAEAAVAPPQPAQRKSQQPVALPPAPQAVHCVVAPAEKVPVPSQAESSSHQSPASPSAGTETIGENPTPAPASNTIGQIVTINERENAVIVRLSTGYQCATRDPEMIAGLKALKESGKRVELIARPARDPRYVPILTEILPL